MLESLLFDEEWQGFFYNGNLTKDSGKGMTNITYNSLHLPNTNIFCEERVKTIRETIEW